MGRLVHGVRPLDWVLAGTLSILGLALMTEDVLVAPEQVAHEVATGEMYHRLTSQSWWMLPVFLVATVAVLWWRRDPVAVALVATAAMGAHVLLFGWVIRCGAGLPLAFVLAFLVALASTIRRAVAGLVVVVVLTALVLVKDATTGPKVILVAIPVVLGLFALGWASRRRLHLSAELRRRNEELQQVRDRRVSAEVSADRSRVSNEIDGLLLERLDTMSARAEAALDEDPVTVRSTLAAIESDGRQALEEVREAVWSLRGDGATLAPAPSVAHLDTLLASRPAGDVRLRATGDPRALPATLELTAYRIVEHLIGALGSRAATVDVTLTFLADALEIRVSGPVRRGQELRAAVTKARERAAFHHGTLEVGVEGGQADVVATLPLMV